MTADHRTKKQLIDELLKLQKLVARLKNKGPAKANSKSAGQKRTEKALRESEERLNLAIRGTGVGLWDWQVQTGAVVFNERWAEIVGYRLKELRPLSIQTWLNLCHPDDLKQSEELLNKHFAGETDYYEYEARMRHRNGEWVWVLDRGKVVKWNTNGKPLRMTGTHLDITKRKLSEQSLRDSETNFRTFFETIDDMIVVATKEGRILFTNGALERKLEYSTEDLVRMHMLDLHSADMRNEAEDIFASMLRGERRSCPLPVETKKGTLIPVDTHAWLGRWNGADCIFGFCKDLSAEQEANQRFEHLFNSNPASMAVSDFSDRKFVEVNDAFLKTLGYSKNEIIGKKSEDLGLFVDPKRHDAITSTLQSEGRIAEIELQIRHKDGVALDGLFFGEIIRSQGQQYLLTVMVDATEWKKVERKLREQSEKFQGIFDESVAAIYIFDKEKNFLDSNQAGLDLLGYSKEELLGMSIPDVDADPVVVIPAHQQLLGGDRIINYEHRLVRKDGKIITVLNNSRPLTNSSGEVIGMQSTLLDITERKRANEALQLSETRYQQLFNSVMEGLGILDANEVIQYCNPAFADIFEAKSKEDLMGRCLLDLIPEDQKQIVLTQTEARKSGQSGHYEFEIFTLRGQRKTLLVSASPRFDKNSEYCGAFGAIMDITETKRLQELESRAQRLETAGQIAGQVAHDFNNLLSPIMAYPDFIRAGIPRGHEAHEFLNVIEEAAGQIANINQDLLTMGRRGHYNQEVLNLNQVVTQAVRDMEARTTTITYELDLCGELMNIIGGSAQIHRMLTNLLVNAQEAVHDLGHITIKTENCYIDDTSISYGRVPKGEYAKLTVSDNGCGILDTIVRKIFDPFFTTKITNRKRGSGLGLSVVDAVVKDHKGYIDLTSKVGHGTSFYVYFPVSRDKIEVSESENIVGGQETVLIVDDDQIQRNVTQQLLNKLGYKAEIVACGEKAVEFLKDNPRDIVILDMVMPGGIDGTETFRQILKINPNQRAIILSGFSETERVLEAQNLGAGAFVRKPITIKILAVAVRTELDRIKETKTL
jgi:PAS domain S-box-containing protein